MLHKRTVFWAAGVFVVMSALAMAENHSTVSPSPTTFDHTKAQGSFLQGFIAALSVVVVSELGDKTFFIAAIMAMKHPRLVVFTGAISALVFMTVLSALFGSIATIIPRVYTYYISAALFAIFGIKMLRDGYKMDPNEGQEELEEVQMELKRREDQVAEKRRSLSQSPEVAEPIRSEVSSPQSEVSSTRNGVSPTPSDATSMRSRVSATGSQTAGPSQPRAEEAPGPPTSEESTPGPSKQTEMLRDEKEETLDMLEQGQAENRRRRRNALIKVMLQAASLTFLAEWGDRSQLATIVLATREDVFGVIVGGSLGHAMCTGLAVIGGRMIAQRISVRTVTIIGGIVFLLFAVSALFISPEE